MRSAVLPRDVDLFGIGIVTKNARDADVTGVKLGPVGSVTVKPRPIWTTAAITNEAIVVA